MPASLAGLISPKQFDSIVRSTARLNLWEGSVRSGKTIGSLYRWSNFVLNGPAGDIILSGKTGDTIKRNVVNPLTDMFPGEVHYKKGAGELILAGRQVEVISAYDERSEGRIRGMTIAGAYCDEVTLFPESFFTMLLSRMSVRGAKLFGTTNPDSPFHWLKTDYIDRAGELDLRVFHFDLEDNPFLDPEFVRQLKREYTGLWFQRFIKGLWVLAEGVVYDGWDESRHVVKTPPHGYEHKHRILAVDYGTSNPCTFGLFGWDAPGGRIVLEREYYFDAEKAGRQKTDSQYADDLEDFIAGGRPSVVYVDPSAASFIAELKARARGKLAKLAGIRIAQADNSVLEGIRFVSGLLSRGRFVVDESCAETRKEFGAYVWDPRAQQKGEDAPLKKHDHCMDRNRYGLYTHFGRGGRVISGVVSTLRRARD